MAAEKTWIRRQREFLGTRLYYDLGVVGMIVMPVLALAFSWLKWHPLTGDDLWVYGMYGLIGLACLLTVIIRLLEQVRTDLRSMTFVLYQLLKDPGEEEEVISRATYQHLRRRLGVDRVNHQGDEP
jgi:hypothetical protein